MKNLKAFLSVIAAVFGVFLTTTPAYAIGAVYEVPVTVTVAVSAVGRVTNVVLSGTVRGAVNNHTSTAAATTAARTECTSSATNPSSSFYDGLEEVSNGITSRVVGVSTSPCTTQPSNNAVFADNEYVAFVTGVTVTTGGGGGGEFEVYHGVHSNRASAIALARASCVADYGTSDGNCSTASADIEVLRGQESSSGGGGDDDNDTALIIGGVVVVGGLIWWLSDGFAYGDFDFSPAFGYSATESGYSANVGGRMDFRKDEWHLHYTAGNQNASGAFYYSSGGEYKADLWPAAFSESVHGKTADYDISLSADWTGGIWSLSPTYRMHSRFSDGETETANSLNLEGVLQMDRWTIRPSAGFGWRRADEFGDSAKFRLEAVHRF